MIRFDWYHNKVYSTSATSVVRYRNGRFFYYTCIYIMYTHTRARAERGAEGGYFYFGNSHLLVTCRLSNLFQCFKDWKEMVDSETWDNLSKRLAKSIIIWQEFDKKILLLVELSPSRSPIFPRKHLRPIVIWSKTAFLGPSWPWLLLQFYLGFLGKHKVQRWR